MTQILTDEEIVTLAFDQSLTDEGFARAVETAVLAKVEPLLRRVYAEIRDTRESRKREAQEDYNASQSNALKEYARRGAILAEIREVLGDSID